MTVLSDSLPWFLVAILTILCGVLLFTCFRLRKKHETLKEEHEKRNLLLNSIAEGVYGLDLDGNCTFCNAATLKLLGYQNERELVGRNVHDLIHHTHADGRTYAAEDCKACLAYRQNMEVHLDDEVLWRSDGTSFQAEYWAYPVRNGTELTGAVVSFVDITERKAIEARIMAANRELMRSSTQSPMICAPRLPQSPATPISSRKTTVRNWAPTSSNYSTRSKRTGTRCRS